MEKIKITRRPWTRDRVLEELPLVHPKLRLVRTPDGIFKGKEKNIEVLCLECGKTSTKSAKALFENRQGCICNSKRYIVYKTTNLVNGKYYIGVHYLKGDDDKYIGCGISTPADAVKVARRNKKSPFADAVIKYGFHNFKRETLYRFATKKEAYDKEAEIVTAELLKDPNCYNVALGGFGGNVISGEELSLIHQTYKAKRLGFKDAEELRLHQQRHQKEVKALRNASKKMKELSDRLLLMAREKEALYKEDMERRLLDNKKKPRVGIRLRDVNSGEEFESITAFYKKYSTVRDPEAHAHRNGYLLTRKIKEEGCAVKYGITLEIVNE